MVMRRVVGDKNTDRTAEQAPPSRHGGVEDSPWEKRRPARTTVRSAARTTSRAQADREGGERFFATCPRGLEDLLQDELRPLGAEGLQSTGGGVFFRGEPKLMYRANLHSRLATRILWQRAMGPYRSEEDIYRLLSRLPWSRWFNSSKTLKVSTHAVRCPLRSLDFVTLRAKDAICDNFRAETGERPNIDTRSPDIQVQLFLDAHTCTVYLDTSGAPLWQRGLRRVSVLAPVKENLAAGILQLSGWQVGDCLVDPMCGSGTFILEAAQRMANQAPGLHRNFAFEHLRRFDAAYWGELRDAAWKRLKPAPDDVRLFARDIDASAVKACARNVHEAGFDDWVHCETVDFCQGEAPTKGGTLVANPPYGERLGDAEELAQNYPQWGSVLKNQWTGWQCALLSADLTLPKGLRLKPARKIPLFNGALDCRLFLFPMVAGSHRAVRGGDDGVNTEENLELTPPQATQGVSAKVIKMIE